MQIKKKYFELCTWFFVRNANDLDLPRSKELRTKYEGHTDEKVVGLRSILTPREQDLPSAELIVKKHFCGAMIAHARIFRLKRMKAENPDYLGLPPRTKFEKAVRRLERQESAGIMQRAG